MAQNKAEMTNKFRTYVRKMADYKEAVAVLSWDVMTCAPVRGKEQRAEVIGMLSRCWITFPIQIRMKHWTR